jgi:hypothetical protein
MENTCVRRCEATFKDVEKVGLGYLSVIAMP